MYRLLHNPGAWLFDCVVQVERWGEVPLGMGILSSFAAVPHPYGSAWFERSVHDKSDKWYYIYAWVTYMGVRNVQIG